MLFSTYFGIICFVLLCFLVWRQCLLVTFQFTLKSLDCTGWIRLLLSLLYRIDFVDVFLLIPKYTLFLVGYSSRCPFVEIDLDFLFRVLFVMNHKTSMSILIFECFVPYAMFHCLLVLPKFIPLTLLKMMLFFMNLLLLVECQSISLIQLNLLMQS